MSLWVNACSFLETLLASSTLGFLLKKKLCLLQPFLQWKHPVRIHPHKKSVSPPEEAWKYISESFYDDYIDTSNTGDAKNEVPVTNLATIEFPGNRKTGSLSSHLISGARAQLNPRNSRVHNGSGDTPPAVIRPPSPKSRMMHHTVRGSTLPVLREWLKTASNKERELVLQMLTAAHGGSEDTRLQKAVEDVLRPDSAARVQQWLQTASTSERQTLLGVLETLAVAASAGQPPHHHPALVAFPPASWLQQQAVPTHNRSYSYPISLRPKVSHHHKNHTHTSPQYSRHSHHHHHHHKHHCHKSHKSSAQPGKDDGGGDMTLVGKRLGAKKGSGTPELWHHKIPGPVTEELRVILPGSVFTQPHKYRGRHFAIHPEWPTA
jgi:hypothetical protein